MKKFLLSILILCASYSIQAQNATKDAQGNFKAISSQQDTTKATNTGKTFTDKKNVSFPVYISAKGKLFVIKTSKAGNVYKMYLKLWLTP